MITIDISNKKAAFELYNKSYLGNHLTLWKSPSDFYDDLDSGKWPETQVVALRTTVKPGITPTNYCKPIQPKDVKSLVDIWSNQFGLRHTDICVSEVAEDELITIQGEIMRSTQSYSMRWSKAQTIMRYAWLDHVEHLDGLVALTFVRHYMDEQSYENLHRLFDEFPDSIIEFSCYSKPVGVFGWNTVFWEVREF